MDAARRCVTGEAGDSDPVTGTRYQRWRPPRICGRGYAWLLPSLTLVGIALLDFNTGAQYRFVSWVVLVPGIASAVCGVWTTAGFAVLSLVTYVLVDNAWPDQYRAGLPDFLLVALGGVLAVFAAVVRTRRERRVLHMQDIAETTVRAVLRPLPRRWAGVEQAGVYLAADVEAQVGGDFYDIQPGPYGTRVLVGDVQGKGLGAVEAAAALLGSFREAGYFEEDLRTVAEHLETRIVRHRMHTAVVGSQDGERFATAVLAAFSREAPGMVDIINFGHEAPLAVGPGGVRELPCGDGVPLGLSDLTGGLPPTHRVPLGPDETLLLVTDGVTEARDRKGEFYDVVRDVGEAVAADPACAEPGRLVRRVRDGVLRHSRGQLADDTTAFAVRRLPEDEECPGLPLLPAAAEAQRLPGWGRGWGAWGVRKTSEGG
ncbi:PP2C family protein-serine/threonine phosphatase [Streptomyces sp. AM6-12]|uniref:PP2C family protein-serine/threonine phosphatase n=1 Tax=Streptomyces sp. AM6-12 TaxID=3345149 RepID=UPI0037A65B78